MINSPVPFPIITEQLAYKWFNTFVKKVLDERKNFKRLSVVPGFEKFYTVFDILDHYSGIFRTKTGMELNSWML